MHTSFLVLSIFPFIFTFPISFLKKFFFTTIAGSGVDTWIIFFVSAICEKRESPGISFRLGPWFFWKLFVWSSYRLLNLGLSETKTEQ
ncbi:hypothetical protein BDV40DRAFT_274515 [Aspergillus tamarii]|uniref:Uncharacterized protein n=1 Tax=Aspergillus tamarii TaxID=41984 RepID=A0A5N6UKI1_ASPTM|nr:hypothetical protein BDV40DRAFT_274515 [Aspergillus tamarii]